MSSQNVLVVARFRPQNTIEESSGTPLCASFPSDNEVEIKTPAGKKSFSYDQVFPISSTQEDIFQAAGAPLVDKVLQGFNGTLISYGQTGSGKTHTLLGPSGGAKEALDKNSPMYKHRGMIPRMCEELFRKVQQLPEGVEWSARASFLELYLEAFRDLLEDPGEKNPPEIRLREDLLEGRGVYAENVKEVDVKNAEEVAALLAQGISIRKTFATAANDTSSRSHTIMMIHVTIVDHIHGNTRTRSRLTMVDLAGSEKVGKTQATGQRLEEAKKINLSLTLLGNVINKLTDGTSTHIPYRDAKLTRLLQDSFGGNSLTTLLVNCSPSTYNSAETVSTLMFASRAKRIVNTPKVNKDMSIAELKAALAKALEEIRMLKLHIASLQAGGGGGGGAGGNVGGGNVPSSPGSSNHMSKEEAAEIRKEYESQVTSLTSEIGTLKEELFARVAEVTKAKQEVEFYKTLAASNETKASIALEKWKEEAQMAKMLAQKKADKPKRVKKAKSTGGAKMSQSARGTPSKPAAPGSAAGAAVAATPPLSRFAPPGVQQGSSGSLTERGSSASTTAADKAAGNDDESSSSEDEEKTELIVRERQLRERLDQRDLELARLEKQLITFRDMSRETDSVMALLQEEQEGYLEKLDRLAKLHEAREAEIASQNSVVKSQAEEIEAMRSLLRKHNISLAGLEGQYGSLQQQKLRLEKETTQREQVTVISVDLDIQATDLLNITNEVMIFREFSVSGDEKLKQMAALKADINNMFRYLTNLKSYLDVDYVNPMDEAKGRALIARINNMMEDLESAALQVY